MRDHLWLRWHAVGFEMGGGWTIEPLLICCDWTDLTLERACVYDGLYESIVSAVTTQNVGHTAVLACES